MTRIAQALRKHPAFAVILAAYLVLALAYGIVNPIHEATDEVRHYRFVRYLVNERALPVQDRLVAPNIQAHHPPLYYLTAALASFWVSTPDLDAEPPMNPYWAYRLYEVGADNKNLYVHGPDEAFPWQGPALAAHLARMVTAAWGAAAVWATYLLGLAAFDDKWLGVGAAALVAFNPQFLYLSGAVNNDVPAAAAGAAALLLSVRWVTADRAAGHPRRRAAWLGLAYGLAILTKMHMIVLGGVIALALLWAAARDRAWRRAFEAAAIVIGAAALVSGWWFVRNVQLYGDPTGFVRVAEIWGARDPGDTLSWAFMELPMAWSTLWGRFGYGQIPLPDIFYSMMGVVCGVGLAGLALYLPRKAARARLGALAVIGAQAAGMALVLYGYVLVSPAGAMGRFYFPGLPALGVLIAAGLATWTGWKRRAWAALALNLLMGAGSVIALVGYLAPAYAPPPAPTASNRPAHTAEAQFGDAARLLGYEVDKTRAAPGDSVFVTLHWQALRPTAAPLSVFVHLVGLYDIPVGMRATYTGLGVYPSTLWEPGREFVETYRVEIPATAYTPDQLRVEVGLFDRATGARQPVAASDIETNAAGDAVALGRIEVPRPDGAAYIPLNVNFGDRIALVGYDIYPRVVNPGRSPFVTLYWTALRPLEDESVEDLRVFLQVIGEDGEVYARIDGYPQNGLSLPSAWTPGAIIEDQRKPPVSEEGMPAGFYTLRVGWMDQTDADNLRRLPILHPDGRWAGDALDLVKIRRAATHEEAEQWLQMTVDEQ
ncbi:MAG: glycosyltransferase family 39 protein [Anaerolineae bacterium]|nr:glycosyltransferase family 39 protein [Anaerolineae bacterium]